MIKEIYLPYFKNKKVTMMGLGLLGRGIGDAKFLAENDTELLVTDKKSKEELASSTKQLKDFQNINYVLGEHRLEDFRDRDFILKSAGVPIDSEFINEAKKNNIPVYMSAALVCDIVMKELPEVVIIGVTGTRGKSTTTELIAHILRENGSRVHIGGNIRGVANLPILNVIEDGDFLVLELDSWQLQGFGDLKISPHIAVFTSFLDDHLNYYKNDKELYFNDKANIYRHQKDGDVLIASPQASSEIIMRGERVAIDVPEDVKFEMNLIGEHNQVCAGLAYEACVQCGLDGESIKSAIKTFKAVEGRLQDMGLVNGIQVFNDNNATTCDATIVAVKAINDTYCHPREGGDPGIVLIVGGTDKGLDVSELEKVIKEYTKEILYLSGTGTDKINLTKKFEFEKLEDCVNKAFEISEEGDIILFSPAFASFSKYFNNEYERNDEFVKIIESKK